ncbi:MAG: hypothetical protein H0V57_01620 [Thermoleophilaceae bacterium]|nr:hypothetical protein [Thermoleophilaceae bacterium]
MAKRRTTPKELPDAVREAVDRTVQATRGSAVQTRERAQGAVDDLVDTVDDLVKGAEGRIVRGRRAAARAIDDVRPATNEDMRELKAELRRIGRRLEAIEERLPAKRPPTTRQGAKSGSGSAKPRAARSGSSAKPRSAKRGSSAG